MSRSAARRVVLLLSLGALVGCGADPIREHRVLACRGAGDAGFRVILAPDRRYGTFRPLDSQTVEILKGTRTDAGVTLANGSQTVVVLAPDYQTARLPERAPGQQFTCQPDPSLKLNIRRPVQRRA